MQKEKMPIRINQHLVKRAAAVISCYSYKNLNVVKELILFMQFYEKKKKKKKKKKRLFYFRSISKYKQYIGFKPYLPKIEKYLSLL